MSPRSMTREILGPDADRGQLAEVVSLDEDQLAHDEPVVAVRPRHDAALREGADVAEIDDARDLGTALTRRKLIPLDDVARAGTPASCHQHPHPEDSRRRACEALASHCAPV